VLDGLGRHGKFPPKEDRFSTKSLVFVAPIQFPDPVTVTCDGNQLWAEAFFPLKTVEVS
jgi:hypothetical protein